MPAVSLIIPTRNCRSHLARLLDSIERQTFRDLEVIVVDNFSTDGTFELAASRTTAFRQGPRASRPAGVWRGPGPEEIPDVF